jgi:hypothetical protein
MVSRLIDRGRELIYVWPVVAVTNSRGDVKRVPADTPEALRCTTSEDRSQIADLPGQVDVHILRVTTRKLPLDDEGMPSTWVRVMYRGAEYDLAEPPRFSPGPSKALDHWEFKLRSRANLSPIGTEEQRAHTIAGPPAFGPVGGE